MTGAMNPKWQAALATTLIFLLGAVAGVAADRVWLGRAPAVAQAATLTPAGMEAALNLTPSQAARVRAVLDSLRGEVVQAAQAGPDSLRDVAQRARQRLEEALPMDRRASFQEWMQQHHARMMQQMGGGMMQGGAGMRPMGPGMMGSPAGGGRMMGPPDSTGGAKQPRGGMSGMMGPGMMGPGRKGSARPDSSGG